MVERLVITNLSGMVELENLPSDLKGESASPLTNPCSYDPSKTLTQQMEEVEKKIVLEAYQKHQNSVALAKALGISQSSASRKINKYLG